MTRVECTLVVLALVVYAGANVVCILGTALVLSSRTRRDVCIRFAGWFLAAVVYEEYSTGLWRPWHVPCIHKIDVAVTSASESGLLKILYLLDWQDIEPRIVNDVAHATNTSAAWILLLQDDAHVNPRLLESLSCHADLIWLDARAWRSGWIKQPHQTAGILLSREAYWVTDVASPVALDYYSHPNVGKTHGAYWAWLCDKELVKCGYKAVV